MRVGDDLGRAAPAALDLCCCTLGEGDQGVSSRDKHVQMCIVGIGGIVVRVAQVMDGVEQGFTVPAQGGDGLLKCGRVLRVEAEVDVENIE